MPPFAIKREQISDVQVGNDISQRRDSFSEDFLKEQMRMRGQWRCEDSKVLRRSRR